MMTEEERDTIARGNDADREAARREEARAMTKQIKHGLPATIGNVDGPLFHQGEPSGHLWDENE